MRGTCPLRRTDLVGDWMWEGVRSTAPLHNRTWRPDARDAAHGIAQDMLCEDGAWLHAFLHRREGDLANADYWYRRAGRRRPEIGLDEEWRSLVEWFASRQQASD